MHEEEVCREREEEERRRHHRREALQAAIAGWDYPDALYITPGTGLSSVQVCRTPDGMAVLA
ncbi:hypothetical protein ACH4A1_16760 [Streptomyces roseoverticillatus]|uniref:hypothetical protein n=1 Tax=Streptomyces roseoverticillatus TaxID=66429 RepID=UPI003793D723